MIYLQYKNTDTVLLYILGLGRIPDIRLISNDGYPVPANIWPTFDIRQITGYTALKISRVSGIRIVSISGFRPDIENGRISGPTLGIY